MHAFYIISVWYEHDVARPDRVQEGDICPSGSLCLSGTWGCRTRRWTRRIAAARKALGSRVVILGHHYQRDEVIKFADYTGDSYKLAGEIAKHPEAEFIIFCGVHFMAESADVLSAPSQQVILPDLAAGCSMADMAAPEQLEMCWNDLAQMGVGSVIPVTYINSAASIKAFCRRTRRRRLHVVERRGDAEVGVGARRARAVPAGSASRPQHRATRWACRSTTWSSGIPTEIFGGLDPDEVKRARIILWKGHCSVHTRFTVRQIENAPRAASGHPRHRASRSAAGTSCRPPTTAGRPNTSSSR